MSLYAFYLGQIISTFLRQVETDHAQKRHFRHSAIYQTIEALPILRCLYGSEMVVLGVVISKCQMPSTDISQENDHALFIVKYQFVAYNFK